MYISHFSEPKPTISSQFDKTRFAGRSATHVFPVGHVSPNPGTGMMYLMRTVPTGPTTSRQEYDVYKLHTPRATPENHAGMVEFYQKVENEDIFLCNSVQTNLQRGVFLAGPLHSFREEGVLAFHRMVKSILLDHVEQEKEAGGKIWPAEAHRDEYSAADKDCDHILSCTAAKAPELEW
jgi:Ring hydroxylating alpha subunit (catalytic domain)